MCFRDFGVLFKVFSTNTFISPSQLAPQIELKVNVETNPPRITWSIDANLGIEAFQIIVWDKPDSEEIIPVGSVTSLELTDLAKCIEYTVQVMAVKEGLPLLEICSAPVSFTILEGVYTPKLTVENTAPDEVHASWTEPTSCQASDYIYKLSVTHAGSEPRTITKLFPTTDLESPTHLRLLAMNASHLTLSWIESAVWDICGTVKHVVTVVPLDGDPPTIVTVDGTSATVSVNECSWYEIYVHMETADSMFRSARSNGIVLQSPLRPYGVPDFEIVNLNPGIQKISWNGGVEWTSECVRKYDVTISPVKSLGKEFKFTMLSGDPGAITGELLPCTEYQYTVSSGSESKTKILKTLPSSFLPTDVTAVINSPNALKVNWGAPRCVESIGDVHYSVTIRPSNEGSETMKQEVAKDSLTQGAVEFQVKPCTAYLVYMEADTMGLKDRSKLIMVKDGRAKTKDSTGFQNRNLIRSLTNRAKKICSEDALEHEWRTLTNVLRDNGFPDKFITKHLSREEANTNTATAGRKPVYTSLPMKEHNPPWLASGTRRTVTSSEVQRLADTAHNVIPSQSFRVFYKTPANQPRSVQQRTIAVAEAIAIRHRDPILCRQKRFVHIEKPKVTVTNIEPGVQKVSWTDPIAAPECRHLFEVQQTNVFTGGQVTITVSATERIFVELTHCTNYEYTVRVVGEHVSGQKSDPVRLVTISPKPETPTLIEVTVEGPTSVKLTWSTPIPHDHCSHTGYIVTAQAANDPSIRATTDLQYKTLTVKTCTSYLVAVQAQYSDGSLSEKSQFRAVTTPAYVYTCIHPGPIEPAAPVDLQISVNSAHKQVLKWREPHPGYKCPHMYELERTETGPEGTNVKHIRFESITHEYVVLSLKPRTINSYRLRIIGLPGNVVGPYSVATSKRTTGKETLASTLSDHMTTIDSSESTISLRVNFSSLVGIPDLQVLSLLIQPQPEQSPIGRESAIFPKHVTKFPTACNKIEPELDEGSTKARILPSCPSLDRGSREADVGFEPRTFRSVNSWNNRLHHGTEAWEWKLWERSEHASHQTAHDGTIILGQTVPCSDSPYCEPGQLMPGSIYGIQLRLYSPNGVFTSHQIFAATKSDLICLKVLLGVFAAVAGCAVILAKFAYTCHTSASWDRLEAEAVKVETERKPDKTNKKRSWTEQVQRVGRYSIMRDDEEGSNFRRTGYMPTNSVVQTGRTIGELRAYLDECLQPTCMQLDEEFTTLRQNCLKKEIDENMTTNIATDPKNHALNRYPDIIPYDHNAVLLSGNNPLQKEVHDSNPISTSRLSLSRFAQPGSIQALALPSGGMKIGHYINASYIYAVNPSKDAQAAPKLNPARVDFIAAQAPLKKTIADFWEMIAENHVSLIVMLTQLVEDNVPKCARYWPDEVYATTIHMSHGNELAVTLIAEEDYPSYTIRKISLVDFDVASGLRHRFTDRRVDGSIPTTLPRLVLPKLGPPSSIAALVLPSGWELDTESGLQLKDFLIFLTLLIVVHFSYPCDLFFVLSSEDAVSTTVTQLQMKLWPEHGVPYLADFTAVINEYQKLKVIEENRGAPTLVHCSTGSARSGVFIAADIIKRQLDSGEGLFDIQGTVELLRECRMHMVHKV
ncbi:LOW QUALITY PROTEIN: hypothetical protein T265_15390, partial [Opisthorchis viverrini]